MTSFLSPQKQLFFFNSEKNRVFLGTQKTCDFEGGLQLKKNHPVYYRDLVFLFFYFYDRKYIDVDKIVCLYLTFQTVI